MFRKRPPGPKASNVVKFRRPKPKSKWSRPDTYGASGARWSGEGWLKRWGWWLALIAAATVYVLWRDGIVA